MSSLVWTLASTIALLEALDSSGEKMGIHFLILQWTSLGLSGSFERVYRCTVWQCKAISPISYLVIIALYCELILYTGGKTYNLI